MKHPAIKNQETKIPRTKEEIQKKAKEQRMNTKK